MEEFELTWYSFYDRRGYGFAHGRLGEDQDMVQVLHNKAKSAWFKGP